MGPNEMTAGSVMGDGDGYTWTGSGDDGMRISNITKWSSLTFGNATLCEIFNCTPPRVQFNIGGLPKRETNQTTSHWKIHIDEQNYQDNQQ